LKSTPGAAGTQVLTAKFFDQLFFAMHDAVTAPDLDFGRESFAALATARERRIG
jgi:hypothetical protein